jgi:hypothetical protein
MFELTGKNFHENIKRMEEETERCKKQTAQILESKKEIDKISTEIKNAAEANDRKKMLKLIQQMTNMVANEIK